MLVKYANFVKIQPIAPDKKSATQSFQFTSWFDWAFIFKIIQVRIMNTFSFWKSEETHLAPLTHLAQHTILAKFSGLNLKSGSHLQTLLHIIV